MLSIDPNDLLRTLAMDLSRRAPMINSFLSIDPVRRSALIQTVCGALRSPRRLIPIQRKLLELLELLPLLLSGDQSN